MCKIIKQVVAHAGEYVGEGNTYSLLVGVPSIITTIKIKVEIPQKVENLTTTKSSYATRGHITSTSYLVIDVHCCSIHNRQKLETG